MPQREDMLLYIATLPDITHLYMKLLRRSVLLFICLFSFKLFAAVAVTDVGAGKAIPDLETWKLGLLGADRVLYVVEANPKLKSAKVQEAGVATKPLKNLGYEEEILAPEFRQEFVRLFQSLTFKPAAHCLCCGHPKLVFMKGESVVSVVIIKHSQVLSLQFGSVYGNLISNKPFGAEYYGLLKKYKVGDRIGEAMRKEGVEEPCEAPTDQYRQSLLEAQDAARKALDEALEPGALILREEDMPKP